VINPCQSIAAHHSEVDLLPDDFDHPEWTKAIPIAIARHWSGDEAPASQHAEACIVWSDKSLGVRFICNQTEPLIVSATPQLDRKTIGVWDRDVCEIFIAPDARTPNRYFEFEAAPNGEWVDLGIHMTPGKRETNWGFQSGMTTASRLTDDHLTIGMRIPWSDSIPLPKSGDLWRINLFRCVGIGNERYLAWQPTHSEEPNFHVPEVFGWLRFL
jgi:alpha-galactosidase